MPLPRRYILEGMNATKIQTLIGGVVVGLILGALLTWLYLERVGVAIPPDGGGSPVSPTTPLPPGTPPPSSPPGSGMSAVVASTQAAGMVAVVSRADIEVMGWAVVYESRAGVPGNALGAARIEAGSHSAVVVPLLRGTTPSQTYFVVLHRDDGDKQFELRDDFPLRTTSGDPVMTTFITTE